MNGAFNSISTNTRCPCGEQTHPRFMSGSLKRLVETTSLPTTHISMTSLLHLYSEWINHSSRVLGLITNSHAGLLCRQLLPVKASSMLSLYSTTMKKWDPRVLQALRVQCWNLSSMRSSTITELPLCNDMICWLPRGACRQTMLMLSIRIIKSDTIPDTDRESTMALHSN